MISKRVTLAGQVITTEKLKKLVFLVFEYYICYMPNEKSKIAETALYDKLFREISPVFLTVFAEKVLGLDIIEYTELKDKLQMTRQKETDSLRKVTDRSGSTFILQLEIQNTPPAHQAVRALYRQWSCGYARPTGIAGVQLPLYANVIFRTAV